MALGSRNSQQVINVPIHSGFSSFLQTSEYGSSRFGAHTGYVREETVTLRRTDEFLNEIAPGSEDRRIFLKMDTQGYDMEVFRGLGNRLEDIILLQSEVSLMPIYQGMPHWTEQVRAYENAGFGIVGLFPVTRDAARVIEYDCLMVKR